VVVGQIAFAKNEFVLFLAPCGIVQPVCRVEMLFPEYCHFFAHA